MLKNKVVFNGTNINEWYNALDLSPTNSNQCFGESKLDKFKNDPNLPFCHLDLYDDDWEHEYTPDSFDEWINLIRCFNEDNIFVAPVPVMGTNDVAIATFDTYNSDNGWNGFTRNSWANYKAANNITWDDSWLYELNLYAHIIHAGLVKSYDCEPDEDDAFRSTVRDLNDESWSAICSEVESHMYDSRFFDYIMNQIWMYAEDDEYEKISFYGSKERLLSYL